MGREIVVGGRSLDVAEDLVSAQDLKRLANMGSKRSLLVKDKSGEVRLVRDVEFIPVDDEMHFADIPKYTKG